MFDRPSADSRTHIALQWLGHTLPRMVVLSWGEWHCPKNAVPCLVFYKNAMHVYTMKSHNVPACLRHTII